MTQRIFYNFHIESFLILWMNTNIRIVVCKNYTILCDIILWNSAITSFISISRIIHGQFTFFSVIYDKRHDRIVKKMLFKAEMLPDFKIRDIKIRRIWTNSQNNFPYFYLFIAISWIVTLIRVFRKWTRISLLPSWMKWL